MCDEQLWASCSPTFPLELWILQVRQQQELRERWISRIQNTTCILSKPGYEAVFACTWGRKSMIRSPVSRVCRLRGSTSEVGCFVLKLFFSGPLARWSWAQDRVRWQVQHSGFLQRVVPFRISPLSTSSASCKSVTMPKYQICQSIQFGLHRWSLDWDNPIFFAT